MLSDLRTICLACLTEKHVPLLGHLFSLGVVDNVGLGDVGSDDHGFEAVPGQGGEDRSGLVHLGAVVNAATSQHLREDKSSSLELSD